LWVLKTRTKAKSLRSGCDQTRLPAVLNVLRSVVRAGLSFLKTRRQLAVEVLALRHQLGVLERSVKRPRLTHADRGLWVLLSRRWTNWSDALIIVKPATVIRWHRAGFRKYWAWRSRPKGGRPAIDPQIRSLIMRMATAKRRLWRRLPDRLRDGDVGLPAPVAARFADVAAATRSVTTKRHPSSHPKPTTARGSRFWDSQTEWLTADGRNISG
jgi:hypothetical protein